jgi:glucose-1-phosphatase
VAQQPHMIRAVTPAGNPPRLLFDLGGILVKVRPAELLWPGQSPLPGERTYEQRWVDSQTVRDYETGRLRGISAFYHAARSEMGFDLSEDDFTRIFLTLISEPYDETLPLLSALQACYPLMMLSNIGEDHWLFCRDTLGLGTFFDQAFLSYEMGMMKPDARIFQDLLDQLGGDPQNIWYFDDRAENVEAARRFGIRSFLSQGGPPLLNDLQRLNLIRIDFASGDCHHEQ